METILHLSEVMAREAEAKEVDKVLKTISHTRATAKDVPKKFLCWNHFFDKQTTVQGRLLHSCFPVIFAKLLRAPFYSIPLGGCFEKFCKVEFSDYASFLIVKTTTIVKFAVNTTTFGKRYFISMTITGVKRELKKG